MAQWEESDSLHTVLVKGLNVPAVLLVKQRWGVCQRPVEGTHQASLLTAGGPRVHIAQLESGFSLGSSRRKTTSDTATSGVSHWSEYRWAPSIDTRQICPQKNPSPSPTNAKSPMWACYLGRLGLRMPKQIVVPSVRWGNCFLHIELYGNSWKGYISSTYSRLQGGRSTELLTWIHLPV